MAGLIFLLCCFLSCCTGTVSKGKSFERYVLSGYDVVLDGKEEVSTGRGCFWLYGKQNCITRTVDNFVGKEDQDLFWFFRQKGNNKFYKIGERVGGKSNCSFAPVLRDRLESCNTTLKLVSSRLEDGGTYKLRFREGKRKSLFFFFLVDVQNLNPVVVPKALSKYNFVTECFDRNPNAVCQPRYSQTFITTTKRIKQSEDGSKLLFTQMHAKFRTKDTISCCSYWKGWQSCTPSILISIDGSVCEREADRNWCKARGQPFGVVEAHSRFDWYKIGDKIVDNSSCLVSRIGPGNVTACENRSSLLRGESEDAPWLRQRQFVSGEKWRSLASNGSCVFERFSNCSKNLVFRPLLQDSNIYKQKGNESGLFNLSVIPSPGVVLELLEMKPTDFRIKCNYGGFEKVNFTWIVRGVFESYVVLGERRDSIKVWPDCWYSNKYWQARMKIQCKVTGATWEGTSPAFYMEAFRDGCHWREQGPGFGVLFGM